MPNRWTGEEETFIANNWKEMSDKELADELDRTRSAVQSQRTKMGFKRTENPEWDEEDLEFLRNNWKEMTDAGLAEKLDKDTSTLRRKRRELGLKKRSGSTANRWTNEEEKFIEDNWQDMSDEKMAEELNRSKRAVQQRRTKLGLKRKRNHERDSNWDSEETEWLKNNYDAMTDKRLAEELEKSEYQVLKKRRNLGLDKEQEKGGYYNQEKKIEVDSKGKRKTEFQYNIDPNYRRHLKGELGESLANKIEHKIRKFIEIDLGENWKLAGRNSEIINDKYRYTFDREAKEYKVRERIRKPSIRIRDEEEPLEKAESNYFWANKELIREFNELNAPSIDQNFLAVKTCEENKKAEFRTWGEEEKEIEAEIPAIEDFRILAVEVKTTKADAKISLSSTQEKALERAKNTEKLLFYTLKIDVSPEDFQIPSSVGISMKRHE